MRKFRSVLALTCTAFLLTGCSVFDVDTRDKAACDELSDLLTANSESSVPAEASPALIEALEGRVLPKASASFGGTIKELIDSYKSINDKSVFDQFGGAYDTLMLGGKVLERCFELSSKTY